MIHVCTLYLNQAYPTFFVRGKIWDSCNDFQQNHDILYLIMRTLIKVNNYIGISEIVLVYTKSQCICSHT